MKALIIQENGHHEKNRKFRECFSIQRAFQNLGHNADCWGLGHDNYHSIPNFNDYDIIMMVENYNTSWIPNLSAVTKPTKLIWSIDAHVLGIQPYEQMFHFGKFHYILHSTRDFVIKPHHIWFPNFYDEDLFKPLNIPKTINFGFCGNILPQRKNHLEWLHKYHNLHLDIFVIGDDMVRAINTYKIHFNMNIANDINYRSFETIGCGTVLLTNYNPQYTDLGFKHGYNCLMYDKTNNDLERICVEFPKLYNSDILRKIVQNGNDLAKLHTNTVRIKTLLDSLKLI